MTPPLGCRSHFGYCHGEWFDSGLFESSVFTSFAELDDFRHIGASPFVMLGAVVVLPDRV
eukprot:CAMPEP_0185723862 /NCGR_PEP_ID=MMETSP1171-20130828/554_1 /TAXON_ID=374046 /ORGANISM="Helicotheca tamensis, Strain CCMP826" /LENGTH=59 /DNA_ID=CAMNT_0028391619 /DNA_START=299 /DNA_END=474 /DNA_ORIENTATION=-